MKEGLTVNLVCEFEPLQLGLARIIEDGGSTTLGTVVDRVARLGEVALRHDQVFLVEAGQIPELLEFEAADPSRTLQHVVFVGSVPSRSDIGPLLEESIANRSGVAFLSESGRSGRILDSLLLVSTGAFICEISFARQLRAKDTEAEVREKLTDARLSPREQDVLIFIARGLANKEIARELHLAEGTVKAHVSHILSKLGVGTRVDLVRYALVLSSDIDRSTHIA